MDIDIKKLKVGDKFSFYMEDRLKPAFLYRGDLVLTKGGGDTFFGQVVNGEYRGAVFVVYIESGIDRFHNLFCKEYFESKIVDRLKSKREVFFCYPQ